MTEPHAPPPAGSTPPQGPFQPHASVAAPAPAAWEALPGVSVGFTNTIDDFREAMRANGTLQLNLWSMGWWVASGFLLAFAGRSDWLLPHSWPRRGLATLVTLVVTLAPVVLAVTVMLVAMARQLRNMKDPRPVHPFFTYGGWALVGLLVALHFWAALRHLHRGGTGDAEGLPGLMRPVAGWGLFYVISGLIGVWTNRSSVRRIWSADETQHRPRTVEMNEHGVLVTDALSRHQYSWLAFPRYRETPNLFLLYIAKSRFYMIPKRAFLDGAAVEAFRQLIRLRISERPAAFPVVADGLSAVPVHAIPMAARVVRPPPLPGAAFRPPS